MRTVEILLRDATALFYTTESSDPAIISNGLRRWAQFAAFVAFVCSIDIFLYSVVSVTLFAISVMLYVSL